MGGCWAARGWGEERERSGSLASGRIMTHCLQGKLGGILTWLIFSRIILKNLNHSWDEAPQRCSQTERRIGRMKNSRCRRIRPRDPD